MKKVSFLLLAIFLVGFTTACDDDDDFIDLIDPSFLRVVHLSPDAPPVDVEVDNETVLRRCELHGIITVSRGACLVKRES